MRARKLVGQRISELRKSFKLMTQEQRTELAKQAEVELKTGLELMGRDKKNHPRPHCVGRSSNDGIDFAQTSINPLFSEVKN